MRGTLCHICRRAPARCRNRCATCYTYYLDHNRTDRPAHLINRQTHCSQCGRSPLHGRGLCDTCYKYQRQTGRRRPKHRCLPEEQNCKNPACLKPLRLDPWPAGGYCRACYVYRYRNGSQRPPRLTGGPGPWCECGARATRRVEVVVGEVWMARGRGPEVLDLCERCYQLETRPA